MKTNCWNYINCGRELGGAQVKKYDVCPVLQYRAYHQVNHGYMSGRYCWKIVGTLQNNHIRCSYAEKLGDCILCDFFKLVKKEEGADFVF